MKFQKKGAFNKKARQFPTVSFEGKVEIVGNEIVCSGDRPIYDCHINIDHLEYACILIEEGGKPFLLLFDGTQNYVPAHYAGFQEVYEKLSAQLGFNDELFFNTLHYLIKTKKEIWRKLHPANYQFKSHQSPDYGAGFEILSPEPTFVDWDTTYEALADIPAVYIEETKYGQKIFKFTYPVRIGNIVMEHFSAYHDNRRQDVAVLHYYGHCIDAASSDKSYFEFKERLMDDIEPQNHFFGYERDDQNSMSFKTKGMLLSLVYTYNSDWQSMGSYTTLSIKNQREYPELLIDEEYEKNMEISALLEISEKVSTLRDYKNNPRIKRRPSPIAAKHPVVWVDHKNAKIGFADTSYAQVFDQDEIKQLAIQNILPAKGPGGGYLEVRFADESRIYAILSGACHVFDAYKSRLEKLTGLTVHEAPPYHDC